MSAEHLPVAHTCFFQLDLPNYSNDAVMAEKLRYAMYNCCSIDDTMGDEAGQYQRGQEDE